MPRLYGSIGGRLPERRREPPTDEYRPEPDPDHHYEAEVERRTEQRAE